MKTAKVIFSTLGLTALMFGASCKGGSGGMMDSYKAHVEEVCACKDQACVTEKSQAYAKKMQEEAKNADPGDAAKYAEQMKPLTEKYTKCVTDLAMKGAKDAAAAPAGDAAPAK